MGVVKGRVPVCRQRGIGKQDDRTASNQVSVIQRRHHLMPVGFQGHSQNLNQVSSLPASNILLMGAPLGSTAACGVPRSVPPPQTRVLDAWKPFPGRLRDGGLSRAGAADVMLGKRRAVGDAFQLEICCLETQESGGLPSRTTWRFLTAAANALRASKTTHR
ncbi:hypothetical protein [Paraburkholderia sp. UCT31]|uniref:hypothetical protein n=1 Tax=Paraburkholderia sp. UCT31 TaxID=2615209 RepID=UPI001655AE13|nr:hypothetical protein [Paraburkholderia sp. UCT31]